MRLSSTVPVGAINNNCIVCNGDRRDRYVDLETHIHMEGFIAICESCGTFIGKLLGMFTPADVEGLTSELQEALEERVAQDERLARLAEKHNAAMVLLGVDLASVEDDEEPEIEVSELVVHETQPFGKVHITDLPGFVPTPTIDPDEAAAALAAIEEANADA
jgi:hypothetical protein